jgi:hypothetical protein
MAQEENEKTKESSEDAQEVVTATQVEVCSPRGGNPLTGVQIPLPPLNLHTS